MDPSAHNIDDDSRAFVVTKQVELRPFAEAVLCVRVHRAGDPSATPSIVSVWRRHFPFGWPDDGDLP